MPIDYYLVLGVSREADLTKIKQAYRKVAKQCHPDSPYSEPSPEKFREITEAYETLADDAKRRELDIALSHKEKPVPTSRPSENWIKRRTPYDRMDSLFSHADEFFDGFVPGFIIKEKAHSPKKDLFFEAVLTPSEARHGGLFPITVPVIEACPRCWKTGFWNDFVCPACSGTGRVHAQRQFSLSIPPNIKHGTEVCISLEDIGLRNVNLNIIVHIDPLLAAEEW